MSPTPQSLAELFAQYLRRQTAAHDEGLGFADGEGQVVPHEALPIQPIDPRAAWGDALAVVAHLSRDAGAASWEVPPDWTLRTTVRESAFGVAFCVGNFPQMVCHLQPLLSGGDLRALRPATGRPAPALPALLQWANASPTCPRLLIAAAVLRTSHRFEEAGALLKSATGAPATWQALRANEEAALAWHRGQADEALAMWRMQQDTVPISFNRGMAALFLGRPHEAAADLRAAVAQLPDDSAWHHLGQLYLTLAARA